jgi:hypothetical protein
MFDFERGLGYCMNKNVLTFVKLGSRGLVQYCNAQFLVIDFESKKF